MDERACMSWDKWSATTRQRLSRCPDPSLWRKLKRRETWPFMQSRRNFLLISWRKKKRKKKYRKWSLTMWQHQRKRKKLPRNLRNTRCHLCHCPWQVHHTLNTYQLYHQRGCCHIIVILVSTLLRHHPDREGTSYLRTSSTWMTRELCHHSCLTLQHSILWLFGLKTVSNNSINITAK